MPTDYTHKIAEITHAVENCKKAIAHHEDAAKQDGHARTGAIESIRRDLDSYEYQLAQITAKQESENPKPQEPEVTPE